MPDTMSSDRYHKAAKDGLLDLLKDATRKDANTKDDDGMTPVLWAAFEGRLDALRLLAGRGGDPDKCDQFGNTALHLASAKGHMHCVDFLLKFGVNIYALDIDKHSAKDLAAINNRDDILRFLDAATANLEAADRKKAKTMKEIAEKNCEKRIKEYMKRQQKTEQEYENMKPKPSTMLAALKHKIWSSQGNLNKPPKEPMNGAKFSDLVGGSISSRVGAVQKKVMVSKLKNQSSRERGDRENDTGFKIGEIESDGKRTITSLTGLQRDSEVLYVGTFSSNEDNGKRGKLTDVFDMEANSDTEREVPRIGYGTLSRSFSQPDFLAAQNDDEACNDILLQRPTGLFDRPMLGSIAFRRSVTAALSQLHPEASSIDSSNSANTSRKLGQLGKSRSVKSRSFLNISDSDSEGACFSDDEDQEDSGSPIQRFLAVWGLDEYLAVFHKQQIDLDTLMLLTEADLKSLGLPLGPFRKLTFAIQERRNALANPGPIQDSRL
ncbi:pre-mRNA splicing regulator USH1G isoform X1 [Episyrphus balteatus]|uniref:pre-mRNA splicing regulator USH1G isoform X1 n=2 Tax=Episyrphus balteatus TaxID=286459 RepID=UPI002484EFE9|nr:pre-mRNA splicing regulator USH1G isoform X1 [Episyrphus balteatus]